jgi:RNA-directed DNA polymerase
MLQRWVLLRNSYQQLDGKKAVGIDGITKAAYGINLEDNLQGLLRRIQGNAYKPQASREQVRNNSYKLELHIR